MKFNFKNRVRNFKFSSSDVFVPLHEAIMNSIQSIEETKKQGNIFIKIERDAYRIAEFTSGIFSIEIIDDGIGFVEHNFESFCTSDSDYKVLIGGKGVGRINWLKAFEIINIDSYYEENGKTYHKTFDFNIEDEIHNVLTTEENHPIQTKIVLSNLKPEYRSATEISLKEIALKIIEHFATFFVIGAMPNIVIEDEYDSINLNEFFESEKFIGTHVEQVSSNNVTFKLRHVFLNASTNAKHKIYICAQNRVVVQYDLTNIEGLPSSFNINSKKAIYQCYVSSDFLDNDVNSERTYFSNVIFENEEQPNEPHFELGINLYQIVYTQIKNFLQSYLNPIRDEKTNLIYDFIKSNCPQYNYLIKYAKNSLDQISYSTALNSDKLKGELDKINSLLNAKNYEKVDKLMNDSIDELIDITTKISNNVHAEHYNLVLKRSSLLNVLSKLLETNVSKSTLINDFFLMDHLKPSNQTNSFLIDERLSLNYLVKTIKKDVFRYVNPLFEEQIIILFDKDDLSSIKDFIEEPNTTIYLITNDDYEDEHIIVKTYKDIINLGLKQDFE